MYLQRVAVYYDSRGQTAGRGFFLILVDDENRDWRNTPLKLRAIVRKVAMQQCGHFMMGTARAYGHSITLSGTYGNDGLVRNVPTEVFEKAVPLPEWLQEAWNVGGGWNSSGSEAEAMRAWAWENIEALHGNMLRPEVYEQYRRRYA